MAQFETHSARDSRPAIFLDRDGVVNVRRIDDYVKQWSEFIFLPWIFDILPRIHEQGLLAVLVTNQRGISRGLMTVEDLHAIHDAMQGELERRCGHRFDAIYYCPHDRNDDCGCRKPLPGMLLDAAAAYDIDLRRSWMVGDSESDIEAGRAAGCHTAKVDPVLGATSAEILVADLIEAWKEIGSRLHRVDDRPMPA